MSRFNIDPGLEPSLAQAIAAVNYWSNEAVQAAKAAESAKGNGFTETHAIRQFECAQKAEFWERRIHIMENFRR